MNKLAELARRDHRIALLTGDLGFMALEPFRDEFPDRFFNIGVAEQNMIGIATGLAEAGMVPFTYSIATFASLRPFEFIRNGPALHGLPVRVVGMGMGFEYGHAGPTHYGLEDVAVMRTLPAVCTVIPADHEQAAAALEQTWQLPGPVYFSLGKDDRTTVPGLEGRFKLKEVQVLREAGGVAIVTMGSIAVEVAAAAADLERAGVPATVVVVSSFNPDPADSLGRILSRFSAAITVEAQCISGGLGAFVAQVVSSAALRCQVTSLAIRTSPDGRSGSQAGMWLIHGLDRDSIATAVKLAHARVSS